MNTNDLRTRYSISEEYNIEPMNQSTSAVDTPNQNCWSVDAVNARVVAHCTHKYHKGLNYYVIEIQNDDHAVYFTVNAVKDMNVFDRSGYHGSILRRVTEVIEVVAAYKL